MMVVQALLAGVFQVIQMALVLLLAPGLTGLVRVAQGAADRAGAGRRWCSLTATCCGC